MQGVVESLGKGNLKGIRNLLKTWAGPIRGAICLESVELGRLNYFSDGMIRGEILCNVTPEKDIIYHYNTNAILVLNEVINQILELRLPQKPRSRIVIGKISGGFNHGTIAYEAKLGFEIRSDSDEMVKEIYGQIKDIVEGVNKEYGIELKLLRISNLNATRLKYNHPLVKSAASVLKKLGIEPVSKPSESVLSIFLSKKIPAVTLGLTYGNIFQQETSTVKIAPIFKGIAQVLSVLTAIDDGVCDE